MMSQNKTKSISTEIFWHDEVKRTATIEILKEIGAGRAATASLVRVHTEGEEPVDCVEKRFNPGLLTRFVYWCFFQSPFPYQHVRQAISAAYYRRVAASRILRAKTGVETPVAEPLYTRWDEEYSAYVLAARFVKGRGIKPQEADPMVVRRGFYNHFIRPVSGLIGRKIPRKKAPHDESKELIRVMRRFERIFRDSGFTGTGWQTCPTALVSTANLLRTDEGYVMVDLESGIPSVLVPYYLLRSVLINRFPFFDDVEPGGIKKFMEREGDALRESLGPEEYEQLEHDLERLIENSEAWKNGEVAVFRNFFSLIFKKTKRAAVLRARVEAWSLEGVIDEESRTRLSKSSRLYTEPVFLLGAFPGRLGTILRKLKANREYRGKVRTYLSDREKRRERLQKYVDEHVEEWILDERFTPGVVPAFSFNTRFLWHLVASKVTRAGFHRFFLDGDYRRRTLTKVRLFFTSDRYQIEYSKYVIFKGILEWEKEGRITPENKARLESQLSSGSIQEYVRLFGIQAALKFFEFVTSAIKLVGIGWFLANFARQFPELDAGQPMSGRLFSAFLQTAILNPIPVLMMVNTSVWRTLITLSRMISIKRRNISYRIALFFGMIPALGTLAYPVQMYASCRELSIYLMRHILSRIGRSIPIYGGADSLTELWMIKLVNFLLEIFESVKWLWSHTAGAVTRVLWKPSQAKSIPPAAGLEPEKVSAGESARVKLINEYVEELWAGLETG